MVKRKDKIRIERTVWVTKDEDEPIYEILHFSKPSKTEPSGLYDNESKIWWSDLWIRLNSYLPNYVPVLKPGECRKAKLIIIDETDEEEGDCGEEDL